MEITRVVVSRDNESGAKYHDDVSVTIVFRRFATSVYRFAYEAEKKKRTETTIHER